MTFITQTNATTMGYETAKNEVVSYNNLWSFFHQEHGLTLIHSQMDDIIRAVEAFKETFNKGKRNEKDY